MNKVKSKGIKKVWKYAVIFLCITAMFAVFSPSFINAGNTSQVEAFVSRFYQLCLDRQPDQGGLNQWVSDLLSGKKTGADVAKGFVLSKEFIDKKYDNNTFVTILYHAFFDRDPDSGGFNSWVSKLNSGTGRETVVDGFTHSQEFIDLCANYAIIPYSGYKGASTSSTASSATSASSGAITGTASGFASGNKVNFIIWGDDSGLGRPGGRVNGRTDINIFVHLNLDTRKAVLVPIPRDTWTSIPGHGKGKINGAHAIGGNALAEATFEQFTGIPIDFYVITDFDGFIPLINYFGGVTTKIEENIADKYTITINAGTYNLNGDQALAVCRARYGRSLYGGGAYARETQSAMLLIDLLMQKRGMVNSNNLAGFLGSLSQFVWSNISLEQAQRILPVLLSMGYGDVSIQKFNSWPQNFGKASAVGYNEAEKNIFFAGVAAQ